MISTCLIDPHPLMHRRLLRPNFSNISPAAAPDSAFDTNMVIILAVLLCSLLAVLALNSLARCVLRCARRFQPPMLSDQSIPVAGAEKGLRKRDLQKIPVAAYGTGAGMAAAGLECSICLAEFADGDKIRVLPACRHGFHVSCIDTWLRFHSSCPNCRQLLDKALGSTSCLGLDERRLTVIGLGPPE